VNPRNVAGIFSLWEQVKLLQDWAPLLGYGQRILAESDPHGRALIAGDAMEWLAAKTTNKFDDELAEKCVAVLKTREGEDLLRFAVAHVERITAAADKVKP